MVNPDTAYSICCAEFVHILYNAYVIAYIKDQPSQSFTITQLYNDIPTIQSIRMNFSLSSLKAWCPFLS